MEMNLSLVGLSLSCNIYLEGILIKNVSHTSAYESKRSPLLACSQFNNCSVLFCAIDCTATDFSMNFISQPLAISKCQIVYSRLQ